MHSVVRLRTHNETNQEIEFAEQMLQICRDNFPENKQPPKSGNIVSAIMPFLARHSPNPNVGKQVLWLLQFGELRNLNSQSGGNGWPRRILPVSFAQPRGLHTTAPTF